MFSINNLLVYFGCIIFILSVKNFLRSCKNNYTPTELNNFCTSHFYNVLGQYHNKILKENYESMEKDILKKMDLRRKSIIHINRKCYFSDSELNKKKFKQKNINESCYFSDSELKQKILSSK